MCFECFFLQHDRWKELVDRNILWTLGLSLNHGFNESFVTSTRRFNVCVIRDMESLNNGQLEKVIRANGYNIVELHLKTSRINNFRFFVKILRLMPNLEKIVLNNVSGPSYALEQKNLPNFEKLKSLEVIHTDYRLFKCFKKSQITTFKVFNSSKKKSQEIKFLFEFLKFQTKLEVLALRSFNGENSNIFSSHTVLDENPYRLKKLSLTGRSFDSRIKTWKTLWNFIKPHRNTVEVLEITQAVPNMIFLLVLRHFKILRSLRLSWGHLPTKIDFYEKLENNTSVKVLILVDLPDSDEVNVLEKLVEHLPNIEKLIFQTSDCYVVSDPREIIINKCLALKSLNLGVFKNDFPVNWDDLTKSNCAIENLQTNLDSLEDLDVITKNLKLKTLTVGGKIKCDQTFFDVIRKNCTQLDSLIINRSSFQLEQSQVADVRGLRLVDKDSYAKSIDYEGSMWKNDEYYGYLGDDDSDDDYNQQMINYLYSHSDVYGVYYEFP